MNKVGIVERLESRTLLNCDLVTNTPGGVSVADSELRDYIIANEGLTQHAYRDEHGRAAIGVGFALRRRGARPAIESLGLDYRALLRQARTPEIEQAMSVSQAVELFNSDLTIAIDGARGAVDNFDGLSHRQQVAIVDIVFSVGVKGLRGLKKTIGAIEDEDWSAAVAELARSKYARRDVSADRLNCNSELIQSPADVSQPGPGPQPEPEPPATPVPSPNVPLPAVEPAATGHGVQVGQGRVTLPNGTIVNVAGGVVEIDEPEIIERTEHDDAPQNWAGQPSNLRWPDSSLNLVPTLDTLVLGGLYHSVIPEEVVVRSAAGEPLVRDVDYKLNEEWGQVLNLNSRLGAPGTGSVSVDYDLVMQRLDLIQVLSDGTLNVKKGTSAIVCPALPEPDAGAAPLAGIYVFTIDGARSGGFTIGPRNIYPINPASPAPIINPDAIPTTLGKLAGGETVNIAYFGDSITDGAEAGPWWRDRSKTYTSLVTQGLRERFPNANITETLASEGGRGAIDSQNVFQSRVLAPHDAGQRVDLVVIAMGMNDKGVPSLEPFKAAMTDYIELARAAGIEVLLVTPMQSNAYYEAHQTDRAPRSEIARAIREVATEANATCVDVFTEWVKQATRGIAPISQLHNMFNHPGEAGMKLYAEAILRAFGAD